MLEIASISDMKARAANLHDELGYEPLFVTQNGRESLVVQTHEAYAEVQEKLAFMELLITSRKDIKQGRAAPLDDFLESI
ncbi:type II toxin-antitoxin system Phd/YefM family antitoxin [Colwellia psychrerythraea]|uniref:Prevent-host-death protein n=1 Tax=Colwellia psychrerythraea TaxID=28229 RepID=A0A099KDC7_COLPS|nr:hypothetical protein [Colwellia psychrerythraea]KGJ88376.1 Prevent-host-death protein [Colwellia psychrerythraea]